MAASGQPEEARNGGDTSAHHSPVLPNTDITGGLQSCTTCNEFWTVGDEQKGIVRDLLPLPPIGSQEVKPLSSWGLGTGRCGAQPSPPRIPTGDAYEQETTIHANH